MPKIVVILLSRDVLACEPRPSQQWRPNGQQNQQHAELVAGHGARFFTAIKLGRERWQLDVAGVVLVDRSPFEPRSICPVHCTPALGSRPELAQRKATLKPRPAAQKPRRSAAC